jgi:Transposase DDE domain
MILGQTLPHGKTFFRLLGLTACSLLHATRFLLACCLEGPRLSTAQVAGCVRTAPCHRGNVLRFLRRLPAILRDDWLEAVFGNRLAQEPPGGTWLFILDQTYCGHNSTRLQNAYSTSPRGQRIPKAKKDRKDKRNKRKKQPQHSCHCFVFGLLITPTGLRLPWWRPYYTKDYCAQTGRAFHKQTELAAQLVEQLRVPASADVVVLGDTAFDANALVAACGRRRFTFVLSMNGDRVLGGDLRQTKVTDLAAGWAAESYTPVRLTPGTGRYQAQRRAAACRTGLRRKGRTFWVHLEDLEVHNVGTARVLYSTLHEPAAGQAVKPQKVLLSNDQSRSVAELVELYDLRWQIELFFKELKSVLGLGRYRLSDFRCVEGWVSLCLLAFAYLEWYRAEQLRRPGQSAKEQSRWRWQRSWGLCVAIRQEVEREDLLALVERLQTPGGVTEVQALLRRAVQKEYRLGA